MKGYIRTIITAAVALIGYGHCYSAYVAPVELKSGGAVMTVDTGRGARIVSLRRGNREMLLPDSVNQRFYGATMWVSPQCDNWPERPTLDRDPYEARMVDGVLTAVSAVDDLTGLWFEKRFATDEFLGGFSIEYTIHNAGSAPRKIAVWDVARVREGVTYFPIATADIPGCDSNLSDIDISPSLAIYRPGDNSQREQGQKFYATAREPWIAHRCDGMVFVKTFDAVMMDSLPPLQGEVEIFSAPHGKYVEIENHGPYTLLAPGESVTYHQRWYLHDDYTGIPLEDGVSQILDKLTVDEKLAIIHAESKFASGGVARFGLPSLEMTDGPHGIRAEFERDAFVYRGLTTDSVTVFPSLTALAATWNRSLSGEYGQALGEEAAARGKDVLLGPGVNICRTPLGGRNFEYMGEDPLLAGEMCVPYIRGIQGCGVAACAKHFAANNQETLRTEIDARVSERAMREIYLPAFRDAVTKGGVWSIMGAYNKVNGQYACHNAWLINDILKGEWNFDGAVISDWGGTHSTDEAVQNGLDIEMATYIDGIWTHGDQAYDEYYMAHPYREGLLSGKYQMSSLDEKARRVLRLRLRTLPWERRGSICTPEHYDVALRVAQEAIVLMKNDRPQGEESPLLPLASGQRVLVVGDNAIRRLNEGGGSSELKAQRMISPLDGLRARLGEASVKFARGYVAPPAVGLLPVEAPSALELAAGSEEVADSLRREAVTMAREADVVILCGGLNKNQFQDCESDDRAGYELPFGQGKLIEALLEVNPRIVLLLFGGNAMEIPMVEQLPAVMDCFYLGSEAGTALAGVLTGDVNPSGRLPFCFPRRLEDCGAHSFGSQAFPGDGSVVEYAEESLVGYRWHNAKGVPALFPFGHGLSYTTFDYGDAVVRDGEDGGKCSIVEVEITNSGKMAGSEVTQVYAVGKDGARRLAGFTKSFLNPGEKKIVSIEIETDPENSLQIGPQKYAR